MIVNGQLCSTCQAIFTGELEQKSRTYMVHHSSERSFRDAVQQGCYICQRVPEQDGILGTRYWLYAQEDNEFMVAIAAGDRAQTSSFHGEIASSNLIRIVPLRVWLRTAGYPQGFVETELPSTTRSHTSLQRARTWLEDCISNHGTCRKAGQAASLPTRLVRVDRDDDADSHITGNVCETEDLPSNTPYLTLSHCWGPGPKVTLTNKNRAQFQSCIPLHTLSPMFRDAISTTLDLGLEYIWIDSLCIVQDDKSDWEKEAKTMGQVYKNAYCNLSASGFRDGAKGFMLQHRSPDPTPVVLKPQWTESVNNGRPKYQDRSFLLVEYHPWARVQALPLFDRAWVLQEQLLVPRAIHFGTDQIYWECNHLICNEVWPRGWVDTKWELNQRGFATGPSTFQFEIKDMFDRNNNPHSAWINIVENFTARTLTYESDRLPALAGMGSEFEVATGDTYLFGLWKQDIHIGLVFQQDVTTLDDSLPTRRCSEGVPSWSWAAVGGSVLWSHVRMHEWYPMSDVKPSSAEAMSLQIRGMLIHLIPCESTSIPESNPRGAFIFFKDNERLIYINLDQWFRVIHSEKDGVAALLQTIRFMPLVHRLKEPTRESVAGIVVHASPEAGRGVYKRVGVATIMADPSEVADMMGVLPKYQSRIEEKDFQETDGQGNYTITVI